MRLADLDPAVWDRIARDLDAMLDEIAVDEPGDWDPGSIGVLVWTAVNRAATLALLAERVGAATALSDLLPPSGEGT